MGLDFFREETNWEQAQRDVIAWGYPRPVSDLEAQAASWVRYGENVLVWFLQGPETETLALHACAAPEARGRLGTERHMTGIEVIAELLGAKRLWSVTGLPGEDPRIPRITMRRFLSARGWTNAAGGTFRDLGGD
jgi:hypothetical protein